MFGTLTQNYGPTPIMDRMSKHGSKIAKVVMQPGMDLFCRVGSMIAYEGLIDFNAQPPQLGRMAASWATGEGVPLMTATGQGLLYLADYGKEVIVLQMSNEALSVNGKNILAFDAHLQWNIEKVRGVSMLSGMGMFNVVLRGSGWVALTSKGNPVMLDTREAPTFVDTDALVAFTEGLRVEPRRTARLGGLIGRGSGEAFQLGFSGQGFVVVQPSEDERPTFSVRG
ncbi:AIM24 family protein [Frankia sp. CNm7]|uniref:AIM24 family protein n=2 Tax=Frankia nepalensis TaxID=1836974 RepID=A0A937UP87_9ACTN|nr:AIM24 family protein [Frankia nepalensis]MBL7500383.1 AIM24 family protein [Frankia nepalensis]MBL7508681.1 AIM24 family protein [Frankia nepalensis]MBL7518483.1 AIM24 family protein [Frankia nepalensis]MBL7628843.1 AIM24 family protein [Frankia nepalensis]